MEIEAKLAAPARSVLDAIAGLPRIAGYELHTRASAALETIYLDTAAGDLRRGRAAFRIRRSGDSVELTLKESGARKGAVHRRPERTWPAARMPPLPFNPSRGEVRRALLPWTAGAPLEAIVATRVNRRAIEVRRANGREVLAEIDLDEVRFADVSGGAVSRARYEVELELRRGTAADLARILRALRRRFRLRPSARSKLEQALRWVARGERVAGGVATRGARRPR